MRRSRDTFQRMMDRMEDMFREFDVDLDQQLPQRAGRLPVDIEETGGQLIVCADLPGIEKDQITLQVTEDTISIDATDEREVTEEGKNYVRQERRNRRYKRRLDLPVTVDPDSADAEYKNGVLTVTIDKAGTGGKYDVDIE